MALIAQATAPPGATLPTDAIHQTLAGALERRFTNARVLALLPDRTRTAPIPLLFRMVVALLHDARQLDFMVALGTHPPLSEEALRALVGISKAERETTFRRVGLLNHTWNDPRALARIGVLEKVQIQEIAGAVWHPSLGGDTPIEINRLACAYDHILIIGPTFPHEVVGFSGGAKYLFPGIAGADIINTTHWLGALATVLNVIGVKHTPVRALIHAAAAHAPTPLTLVSLVVEGAGLAGVFVGDHITAWEAAADLSRAHHIRWVDRPFQRVLSQAPAMYDELWTAAKAMYKLEPAVADGGELIVYAPHLETVSLAHGKYISEIGYHVRDYYLAHWDRFKHVPLGVLAHGTHLRGSGVYENGVEKARINVALASRIPRETCERLALGYADPAEVRPDAWKGREDEGILFAPKAGEVLYRVRG
ncbi:MAG: lactate racemase domain-containing protein [Anaerolineae bacterium]|nr:lactate racemase domain-containing protein [Anaerolineae bacterium]